MIPKSWYAEKRNGTMVAAFVDYNPEYAVWIDPFTGAAKVAESADDISEAIRKWYEAGMVLMRIPTGYIAYGLQEGIASTVPWEKEEGEA